MHYKEFQWSWPLLIMLLPIQVLLVVIFGFQWGDKPMPLSAMVSINVLFVIILLLFYGMKTEIMSTNITISFGIGLIRKKIKLSDIRSVEAVTTPWYYGWGIRFIPNGIMYNTYGLKSVELKFNNSTEFFASELNSPVSWRIR